VRFLGRESPGGVLTAHDDLQGRQDAHLLAPCAFGAPWQVVQETVAHLGELDGQGRARARLLALQITGDQEQYDLFEAAAGAGEPVAVRLDEVRLERARRFGDVWLGWRLWCALGLDRFCAAQITQGRELVPWPALAAILVIARLCEPSSELHIAQN
jgi:hypothetical protein